jgi:hypothetical protein
MKARWLTALSCTLLTGTAFARVDWSDELERTSRWMVARQQPGGELYESEYFNYVVQVDTVRAIAVWSEYQAYTGDAQFLPNAVLSWSYVLSSPSFDEPNAYTRLESCGWSLKAEMEYSRLTGDNSFLSYATECADYIVNNPPNFANDAEFLAAGQAAVFLYEWAVDRNDGSYISAARDLASIIKSEIEANPARLNKEAAEECGGMVFCAVVEAAFGDPDGRKAWVEKYAGNLETYLTTGLYNNSHNSWYARAQNLAWEFAAEKPWHDAMWMIAQDQLSQDQTDHDGGIPRKSTDGASRDGTWSTAVRAMCAFPPVLHSADVSLASNDTKIPVGTDLLLDFGFANNQSSPALCFLLVFIDIPGFGSTYLGAYPFHLPPGFSFAVNDVRFNIATGSPKGDWKIRTYAYDATGKLQDQAVLAFKVQ